MDIVIEPDGYIEMEEDQARHFLGVFKTPVRAADGTIDPKSFKKLMLDPDDVRMHDIMPQVLVLGCDDMPTVSRDQKQICKDIAEKLRITGHFINTEFFTKRETRRKPLLASIKTWLTGGSAARVGLMVLQHLK